jgi:hypothetical protein
LDQSALRAESKRASREIKLRFAQYCYIIRASRVIKLRCAQCCYIFRASRGNQSALRAESTALRAEIKK